MPFQKGHTLSKGIGRTKGPDKVKLSGYIENSEKLRELCEATGWTQGELIDMLIDRARVSNLKKKK